MVILQVQGQIRHWQAKNYQLTLLRHRERRRPNCLNMEHLHYFCFHTVHRYQSSKWIRMPAIQSTNREGMCLLRMDFLIQACNLASSSNTFLLEYRVELCFYQSKRVIICTFQNSPSNLQIKANSKWN